MAGRNLVEIARLYAGFEAPITALDCGKRCAPYNERGVPFCCDTHHTVPTASTQEWSYLQANSDLWHAWQPANLAEKAALSQRITEDRVLMECRGHLACQRDFRSLDCRAFPFFPYLSREEEFLGLAYYWEYEDRCWVISNLSAVSRGYLDEFVRTFDLLFEQQPEEKSTFKNYSAVMRRVFGRAGRAIPLLHRNGHAYKISPRTGRLRRVTDSMLPKHGVYIIAAALPFKDEHGVTDPEQ